MDYKNGKIYKLVCSETQNVYIGSTCSTLVKRLHGHKKKSNKCTSKTFIEPKIFLIEDFPCERKEQLNGRERHYIETIDCVNMIIPGRTKKEYEQDNKEKIIEKYKEYNKKNKEKINEKCKKYYQENKEKINEKHKKYYQENKYKISGKNKKHYHENKDKILEKQKKKYTCKCGSTLARNNKADHEKSKKHKLYIDKTL